MNELMSSIIIEATFVCIWLIMYPRELQDALLFRHVSRQEEYLISILSWGVILALTFSVVWVTIQP